MTKQYFIFVFDLSETQSEVARLREENQLLDEKITKLQVENEQLRRRRKTMIGLGESELRPGQRSVEKELAVLREVRMCLHSVKNMLC